MLLNGEYIEKLSDEKKKLTNSEKETKELGKKIAESIGNNKKIIVLNGELGAGKTKFTEGFLSYYGLENEISSPTFTIVNEYKNEKVNIYHFDVYRLLDVDEFYAIGGEEYFDKGICLIEWGEQIEDALPLEYIKITLKKNDENENTRILNFEAFGKKYEDILDKLQSESKKSN